MKTYAASMIHAGQIKPTSKADNPNSVTDRFAGGKRSE